MQTRKLDRDALAKLLPHKDAMCLLESVVDWDDESIECRAVSHRDRDNPLRIDGKLRAICAAEYAAQAMAVHGALAGPRDKQAGMLAALREIKLFVVRLDDIEAELTVRARKLIADGNRLLYEFSVASLGNPLVSGRAAVFLGSLL